MTQDQAQAKAQRRISTRCQARTNKQYMEIIIPDNPAPGIHLLLGWGSTWAEALEHATQRAPWHLGKSTNDNAQHAEKHGSPPEHTAQASETFTQMRLFP